MSAKLETCVIINYVAEHKENPICRDRLWVTGPSLPSRTVLVCVKGGTVCRRYTTAAQSSNRSTCDTLIVRDTSRSSSADQHPIPPGADATRKNALQGLTRFAGEAEMPRLYLAVPFGGMEPRSYTAFWRLPIHVLLRKSFNARIAKNNASTRPSVRVRACIKEEKPCRNVLKHTIAQRNVAQKAIAVSKCMPSSSTTVSSSSRAIPHCTLSAMKVQYMHASICATTDLAPQHPTYFSFLPTHQHEVGIHADMVHIQTNLHAST